MRVAGGRFLEQIECIPKFCSPSTFAHTRALIQCTFAILVEFTLPDGTALECAGSEHPSERRAVAHTKREIIGPFWLSITHYYLSLFSCGCGPCFRTLPLQVWNLRSGTYVRHPSHKAVSDSINPFPFIRIRMASLRGFRGFGNIRKSAVLLYKNSILRQ